MDKKYFNFKRNMLKKWAVDIKKVYEEIKRLKIEV